VILGEKNIKFKISRELSYCKSLDINAIMLKFKNIETEVVLKKGRSDE